MNTMDSAVLTACGDGIGVITLNRPKSINAINDDIRSGIPAALRQLDCDDSIRVIVIRGNGPRGFCAGADIKEAKPVLDPIASRTGLARDAWIEAFDRVTKPVIAAIHGYCMGGGLEIALACDIRIAAPDATFGLPETGLGLIPGGGGTQRLPRLVGLGRALDLLITGDRLDAAAALNCGLVTRRVESVAALQPEAMALAARIAARPATAIRLAKEAARAAFDADLRTGLRLERDLFSMLLASEERRAAAESFRERSKAGRGDQQERHAAK